MKLYVQNETDYMTSQLRALILAGLRAHRPAAAKLKAARAPAVSIHITKGKGGRPRMTWGRLPAGWLFKLWLPKAQEPLGIPEALAADAAASASRLLRYAGMRVAGFENADMTDDQRTFDGEPVVAESKLYIRVRAAPDVNSPDAKQRRHQKKIDHAVAMIASAEKKVTRWTGVAKRWNRKLSALRASSHRVGVPAAARQKPVLRHQDLEAVGAAIDAALKQAD